MNYDRIEQLLNIAEKSLKWPALKPLHDSAVKQIEELIKPPTPKVAPAPKVEDEAEAEEEKEDE